MFTRKRHVHLAGLALSLALSAPLLAAQEPFCPFAKPAKPIPQIHLQSQIVLPQKALQATLLTPRGETMIEIQTNTQGKITCATPLRFSSLLLQYEMSAIEKALTDKTIPPDESPRLIILPDPRPLPPRSQPRIIVVPDPLHPPPEALRDPALEKLTCESRNIDELLDVIRQLDRELSANNIHKRAQCMNAAIALEPHSFALEFLASRIYATAATSRAIVGNERQEFLEKSLEFARSALVLDTQSAEAQDQLRSTLHNLGKVEEEERVTQNLTSDENPPKVQRWGYTFLAVIYDAKDDRRKALLAARKAEQIQETMDALEATNGNDLIYSGLGMEGRQDLAAREEEASEYTEAASDYKAARDFAKPGLYYDAVFFKIDMGLARSLRLAGQIKNAAGLCSHWRNTVKTKIHIFGGLDHGGGAIDWGGSDVASATWDYSCGDFDKAVADLIRISEARLKNPSHKWGDGTAGYYLHAPLHALESAFLSRGMTEGARQTRAILSLDLDSVSRNELDEALKRLEKVKPSPNRQNPLRPNFRSPESRA